MGIGVGYWKQVDFDWNTLGMIVECNFAEANLFSC